MADNIDEFAIVVKLEVDKVSKELDNLTNKFDDFSKTTTSKIDDTFSPRKFKTTLDKNLDVLTTSTSLMKNVLTKGLVGFGAYLGVEFVTQFVNSITSNAHQLQSLSGTLGSTPQQLQLLQETYKRAGFSPETATGDISAIYHGLRQQHPDQALLAGLKTANVNIRDEKGNIRDASALLNDFLANISKMPSSIRRGILANMTHLSDATLYFGNNQGTFEKYKKEVAPNILTNEQINQFAEVDRQFQDISQRWKKIDNTLLSGIMPGLQNFTTAVEGIISGKYFKDVGYLVTHPSATLGTFMGNKPPLTALKDYTNSLKSGNVSLDEYTKATAAVESSNGKNLYRDNRNKNPNDYSFGKYQITLNTARQLQPGVTDKELMANNYALANKLGEQQLRQVYNQVHGDINKAGALYNTGKTRLGNAALNYDAKLINNIIANRQHPNQNHTTNNHHTAYNFGDLYLHGVNDAQGLINQLHESSIASFNSSSNQGV